MEQDRFRLFLQDEYLRRRSGNPNYSLRSFAKSLQLDPGSLSQFLNGRRKYSSKKIKNIALQLEVDQAKLQNLFGADSAPFAENYQLVEYEKMHLLANWYYLGILECVALEGFQPTPQWIGKQLGLPACVISLALSQLFAHKVLTINEDGSWTNHWQFFTTQVNENVDEIPLRQLQKQLLEKAAQSIEENSAEEKSHSSYVSAMDAELVPEIKEEIRLFRQKIAKLIEQKSKKRDTVYCLQLNLFPQTLKNKMNGDENV